MPSAELELTAGRHHAAFGGAYGQWLMAHSYQRLAAFDGAYGQWLMAHGYQRLAAFGGAYG